jgi:BASS family bile acid:Na+ symporter
MQEWAKLAVLALKVSILLQVAAIGLGTTWQDATYLFRRPVLLVNSVLSRNVVVPILAVLLIKLFPFHPAIAITLGALAVTPVPPLLPRSQLKMGARSQYVLGLLVSQSLLAIVLVPITLTLMDRALGVEAHFSSVRVALLLAQTILIPLAAGMLAAKALPHLRGFAPQLTMIGTLLLVAGAIPLSILGWKAFGVLAGDGSLLALAIFIIAGTVAGHFLGGPRAEDRRTLAVGTSSRHPALALAIAHANFPEQTRLVAGAIMIYLVLRTVIVLPYLRRSRSSSERDLRTQYGTRRLHS